MDSEREIAHLTTQYAGTEINMIQDYKGVNKLVSFCLPNRFWKLWNHPRQLLRIKLHNHFILVFSSVLLVWFLFICIYLLFTLCIVLFVLYLQVCFECMFDWHNQLSSEKLVLPKMHPTISKWMRCYKMIWTFCSTGQDIHDLPPGMLFFTARGWIVSPRPTQRLNVGYKRKTWTEWRQG